MQLTARLALLVALVYAAPRVLALPIAGNSESIIARDVQYDLDARDLLELDAREVDDLQFAARELLERYHQARDLFDDFDAREFDEFLFSRGPKTKALSQTIDADVTAIATTLMSQLKTHANGDPVLGSLLTWLDQEHKDRTFWKSQGAQYGSDDTPDDPKSISFKTERAKNLGIIKKHAAAPTADVAGFKAAVTKLHSEMSERHKPYDQDNLKVAKELKDVLDAQSVNPQNVDLLSFALAKNEVLYLLTKISKATDNAYHTKAISEITAKKQHNAAVAGGTDPAAKAASQKWQALLAAIKKPNSPEGLAEVKKARDHVKRLRIIAANNKDADFQKAVAAEDAYRAANPK